jgi:hypothetical protein
MARNMIYKNGPFEGEAVEVNVLPYGTVIRLRGNTSTQRLTALVLMNGTVRILRNGNRTIVDRKDLGVYACANDLLSSVDQTMTVEITFPKCEPYICEDVVDEMPSLIEENKTENSVSDSYDDLPTLISPLVNDEFQHWVQSQENHVQTGRKAGTVIRTTDNKQKIGSVIYGVILQSGNIFMISYNNTNCINFSLQYEYSMPEFKKTYGITENEMFTVY